MVARGDGRGKARSACADHDDIGRVVEANLAGAQILRGQRGCARADGGARLEEVSPVYAAIPLFHTAILDSDMRGVYHNPAPAIISP